LSRFFYNNPGYGPCVESSASGLHARVAKCRFFPKPKMIFEVINFLGADSVVAQTVAQGLRLTNASF